MFRKQAVVAAAINHSSVWEQAFTGTGLCEMQGCPSCPWTCEDLLHLGTDRESPYPREGYFLIPRDFELQRSSKSSNKAPSDPQCHQQ